MKKTFTIAVDLDETLAGTFRKIFEFGQKKHSWTLSFEEAIIVHDWWENPHLGITRAQAHALFDEYFSLDPIDATIPQVVWARPWMLKLFEMWGDIHIITARTESKRSHATKMWLSNHLPEIDFSTRVHFTNHYETVGTKSKGAVCQSIGADILIDDNFDFLLDASTFGIYGILLDTPWNQNKDSTENIFRVKNWAEVPATVVQIQQIIGNSTEAV